MSNSENPYPHSMNELSTYITSRLQEPNTYESVPETLADIALAAFNYACGELGVTGYQASIAELVFLGKSRRIKGPFALVRAEDDLYPQNSILDQVEQLRDEWSPWLKDEAAKLVYETATKPQYPPHPQVYQHWVNLANADQEASN